MCTSDTWSPLEQFSRNHERDCSQPPKKTPICEWLLAANSCSPQDLFPRCKIITSIVFFHQTNVQIIAYLKLVQLHQLRPKHWPTSRDSFRGLDETKLTKFFLRFTTASGVLVTDRLTISFTNVEGLKRRPITHTCSYTLDVASTYANFCELREEFMAILKSDS